MLFKRNTFRINEKVQLSKFLDKNRIKNLLLKKLSYKKYKTEGKFYYT